MLNAAEIDLWRRAEGKSKMDRVRNVKTKGIMNGVSDSRSVYNQWEKNASQNKLFNIKTGKNKTEQGRMGKW